MSFATAELKSTGDAPGPRSQEVALQTEVARSKKMRICLIAFPLSVFPSVRYSF